VGLQIHVRKKSDTLFSATWYNLLNRIASLQFLRSPQEHIMNASRRHVSHVFRTLLCFAVVASATATCLRAGETEASRTPPIIGRHLPDFLLPDTTSKQVALHDLIAKAGDKGLVIVYFMGTDCPISNLYLKDLADLAKRYEKQGVQIVGIQANAGITPARAAEHARQFKVAFPVLIDAGQRVARQFGATRTAEVFVLDRLRSVRYHGEIDDRYGYTFKRGEPTRRELEQAVQELLAGKPVSVAETTPRGCLITHDDRPSTTTNVTYARDISRIFQRRCQECHRAGEVAPFALEGYDDAVEHSAMIKEVAIQRRMPPWHADPRYGKFTNDRRLTQDEIDKIVEWTDAGAPLGDKNELPPPRKFAEGWQIGKPDLVFQLRKPVKVPATGTVPYMYFIVPTKLKEDVWVQAAEARPGTPSVVHHIIVFFRAPDGGNSDGELQDHHLCGTAPGDPPLVLPPGVARLLPAGSDLIFQMHYTPNGKATTDQSKVGLILYKGPKGEKKAKPERSALTHPVMNTQFRIPANDPNSRVESAYRFPDDATILQLMPHMHWRGKDFLYELKYPDGRTETLLSVPQYDFAWQNTYRLEQPVKVPKGSTLRCVAHFDNSKDNPANPDPKKAVRWGEQTWEEMMIGWVTYAWKDQTKHAAD
jgi:peroxiredoxin